jgi:uncharacterized membrane protein
MSEPAAEPTPPQPRRGRGPFLIGLVGGLLLSALLIVPAIIAAVSGERFGADGREFGFPGLILPLLVLAGLVWLVTWIAPRLGGRDAAFALVRERYARGEIDDAEYARLREGLRHEHR